MVGRTVKFPLEMKNGVQARNLADLQNNFDVEKIIGYFLDGRLKSWLEARYYEEEAEAIENIDKNASDLAKQLCEVFGVEYDEISIDPEEIERRNTRITKLKQITSDEEIIKNVDSVAFNQEELADLYDLGKEKIYLCEGKFNIPKSKQNLKYITVGSPQVEGLEIEKEVKEQIRQIENDNNQEKDSYKLPEVLVDLIGWNRYVQSNRYVAFAHEKKVFKDSLKPLDFDPSSSWTGDLLVWDISKKRLLRLDSGLNDEKCQVLGIAGNNVILCSRRDYKKIYIYDIRHRKTKALYGDTLVNDPFSAMLGNLIWAKWQLKGICSCSIDTYSNLVATNETHVAYKDEDDNLYCVELNSDKKTFIENVNGDSLFALGKDFIIYLRNNKQIYKYDLVSNSKSYVKEVSYEVYDLMLDGNKLYLIEKVANMDDQNYGFSINEIELSSEDKTEFEIFRTKVDSISKSTLKTNEYYILTENDTNKEVYVFDLKTKKVNKILSDDISEIWTVGDYLFYKKSNSSIDTVYRLNMITGEKIREA